MFWSSLWRVGSLFVSGMSLMVAFFFYLQFLFLVIKNLDLDLDLGSGFTKKPQSWSGLNEYGSETVKERTSSSSGDIKSGPISTDAQLPAQYCKNGSRCKIFYRYWKDSYRWGEKAGGFRFAGRHIGQILQNK